MIDPARTIATAHDGRPVVVLLQGPLGPFFADLARAMRSQGWRTVRVFFNAGDAYYGWAEQEVPYQGRPESWAAFFDQLIADQAPHAVLAYGDSRFYHREARQVCAEADVPFFALEEAYVRPGYVAMEPGGNNANSRFPDRFLADPDSPPAVPPPAPLDHPPSFSRQGWFAFLYYIAKDWNPAGYRAYRHHRPGSWFSEMMAWLNGARRKQVWRFRDRRLARRLERIGQTAPLFLLPLQVAVDSQIRHHSPYDGMEPVIADVLASFRDHAPPGAHLAIKHHPMDRGFRHYGRLIRRTARRLGLEGRVHHGTDWPLAPLLAVCRGVVTVNSTVALEALWAGVPVCCLGQAMVARAGLTSSRPLDRFWADPGTVDRGRVARYRARLIAETLVPGSFYVYRRETAHRLARYLAGALMASDRA
ncbi:capsular polysaccharide export protein, LipB/KpsS family [Yunchengibacter salinarum]|uniref:capsular polysaccharide export protein, LipB/KpsS family n=1 Tax=Yunchengibacter salinarum TaxID=3133399 RepID=UPI0035B61FE8